MSRPLLAALAALAFFTPASPAAEYVWIEGESPTSANVKVQSGGWGHPEYLSGKKWLFGNIEGEALKKLPAEGATFTYDFASDVGTYEVWARVGYEFVRAPFRWRVDEGEWSNVGPEQLTTDLMALADWTEVAWLRLGSVKLNKGKHLFTFNLPRTFKEEAGKKVPQRILYGLDCICLSKEPFRPNGPHKPDEKWQTPDDESTAKHVFHAPLGKGGQRAVVPLGGSWQVARFDEQEIKDRTGPVKELPAGRASWAWKAIQVPGNRDEARPDLLYCHRLVYRTNLDVPAEARGHSFLLRFPSTALLASVIVNGRYCGFNKTPCTAWECDITPAVKPGEANEVCVVIKDLYYAVARTGEGKSPRYLFNVPPKMFYGAGGLGITRYADFPVLFSVRRAGILEMPSLIVTGGDVYVSDVFARPQVGRKKLALDVTVTNPTDRDVTVTLDNEVTPLGGKEVALSLPRTELMIPARDSRTAKIEKGWPDAKLWWPDDPQQYVARTTVGVSGKSIDSVSTKFGFREWSWEGQRFRLNGVPWSLHADLTHFDRPPKDPEQAVRDWRRIGMNMVRYWGEKPWTGASQQETLDFFDAHGVPVRRSGIFDGEVASYLLVESKDGKNVARKGLFDNWAQQLRAWVRAERNHPSVFIWSIENEITYINARNFVWLDAVEPQIRWAAKEVMDIDPTRPVMIDGGDALRDRSLPVYGNHYNEFPLRNYPDEAYTLQLAFNRYKMPNRDPWPIGDDRPLFLGESFFASGYQPSAFSQLCGESAFLGWPEARKGVGLFAKMLSEGYRWHGVAAFHFWLGPDRATLHHNSWQPVCAFVREWNWTFGSGQDVTRTIRVFNDTRFADPISVRCELRFGGKVHKSREYTHKIPPGESAPFGEGAPKREFEFTAPKVLKRTKGEFILTCARNGKEVFREVKELWVVPDTTARPPALAEKDLAVWDPKGGVKAYLKDRSIPFTEVPSFEKLPSKARVLVVGPEALNARQATDPKWQALAAGGTRVLVLDQTYPLHYQAVPADLEVSSVAGRVAFPENLAHPVFRQLGEEDFFCWSGDHVVYRNPYQKASRGARSLVQCDEGLSCSALAECELRDGLLLLCQLVVGTKLDSDPVARRLFDNLLVYAATWKPVQRPTAVVFGKADLRAKMLKDAGLQAEEATDLLAALGGKAEVVVADASPANLKKLAGAPDVLRKFQERGGWLMLWGLTPEGLANFNKVTHQDHVIRPFRMERVTLAPTRDPVVAGLTMRDVVLESTKKIFPWSGDLYPVDDEFTYIVDLDDIAPFCTCPDNPYGWTQMTNGLVSADAWVFIFSHSLKDNPKPRWTAKFPREETVTRFSIVPNTFYHHLTKLKLVFDGKEDEGVVLDLKPAMIRQDFEITPPRTARSLTLVPVAWEEVGRAPVISIENLWIRVQRPEAYRKSVVPLLNIGGLVKYRMGKGGIILNQLKVQEREANPVNAQKKQTVATTILRNLGAPFAGERALVAGANLRYAPIPLGEKCNQYLTADRGWVQVGGLDLGHFPVGEQRLAGVTYQIRDFRTSPVPACIMLAGPGAKGELPKEVRDIPVGRKADVLFFLHTFHQARDWKPGKKGESPPVVWRYVVTYADGKSVEVPVVLDRGVASWLRGVPAGLPGAAVAWAAPFPKKDSREAVVYQMPWTNPRPGEVITSLGLRYDEKEGNRYGVPAVLAVTAGTQE